MIDFENSPSLLISDFGQDFTRFLVIGGLCAEKISVFMAVLPRKGVLTINCSGDNLLVIRDKFLSDSNRFF